MRIVNVVTRAVQGVKSIPSSWPGLAVRRTASVPLAYARPSTSSLPPDRQDVVAGAKRGHDGGWGWLAPHLPLTILRQSTVAEHIDRALLDQEVGRALRRLEAERHHQRPRGAAMGDRDGVARQLMVPLGDPLLHRHIALAARRRHRPLRGLTPGKKLRVGRLRLRQGRAFPSAITDLAQTLIDGVIAWPQFQGAAHQFHRRACAAERTGEEGARRRAALVARKEIGENAAGGDPPLTAEVGQWTL